MNKANECTCPSGDGSLVHPCPAHPAVEQAGTNVGHGHVFPRADGVKMRCGGPALCSECAADAYRARAALAQPSPAQAEKAEVERPEVAGQLVTWPTGQRYVGRVRERKGCKTEDVMTVAQHERIVGELRAVIAQLRQHKNDYMDSGQETYRALQNEIREREAEIARLDGLVSGRTAERDAALARVAEMEKQEPVATVARVPGEDWNGLHFYRDLQGIPSGTKLYTAPVAQAQHSVPEASEQEKEQGWNLDYRFVERVTDLAASRTEYTTSMEATEQVLLAARELLASAPGKEGV